MAAMNNRRIELTGRLIVNRRQDAIEELVLVEVALEASEAI